MSEQEQVSRVRQWVTLRNASMDVRVGLGLSETVARDLKSAIGRPHDCLLVHEAHAPEDLVRELSRGLADQGFRIHVLQMPECGRDLAAVEALLALLAEAGITSDDLVVALGSTDALAVAGAACSWWCGGTSLAEVPLDLVAAVVAGVTPPALDAAGAPRMLSLEGSARFSLVDVGLFGADASDERTRLAFALMVATAMADSDKAFARLWDGADDLVAGDPSRMVDQLADTIKSRGKIMAATALATRQSIAYGQTFADALEAVVPGQVSASARLADGLRFAARLSVAQESLDIDDMFAQDDLLERLGVGTCEVAVDPDALAEAIRAQRFARSRRLMLALPRSIGRVRLATVDDAMLREHVAAWAGSRP